MSRFYVGQRVRIKFCFNPGRFGDSSGKTGVVTDHSSCLRGPCNVVSLDGMPALREDGIRHLFLDDQLEPATDSYDVVSWKDCAWQPEHLRVNA